MIFLRIMRHLFITSGLLDAPGVIRSCLHNIRQIEMHVKIRIMLGSMYPNSERTSWVNIATRLPYSYSHMSVYCVLSRSTLIASMEYEKPKLRRKPNSHAAFTAFRTVLEDKGREVGRQVQMYLSTAITTKL